MSVKMCSKQADDSDSMNAVLDEEVEGKSDAVSDNCTEYSIRNPDFVPASVSDSLMPESSSIDEEKESIIANKKDSDDDEEEEKDNDEASLDSNYSNKSNSTVSKTSNDITTTNAPWKHEQNKILSTNNKDEFDESIIIPDDEDDGQDDLPLSQVLSSIKKSKTKGEQMGDESETSVSASLDESISNVAAGKSASFKEYLLNLKKRTLDKKISRENIKKAHTVSNAAQKKPITNMQQLKRQCKVCKRKIHQDILCEHYNTHFESSPKCAMCDKVSKSSPLYVTHLLSHLPPQFHCVYCEKWFKQQASYQRHKESCSRNFTEDVVNGDIKEETLNKSPKKNEKVLEKGERPGRRAKLNQTIENSSVKTKTEASLTRSNSIDSKKIKQEPETNQIRQNLRKKVPTNYNEQNGMYQQLRQHSVLIDPKKIKTETNATNKAVNKKSDAKIYVVNKLNFNLRKNNSNDAKANEEEENDDDDQEEKSDYETNDADLTTNKEDETEETSSFKELVRNSQIKNEARLELSTTKDLSSCGTYKVKIQRRRSSASISNSQSFKQKENESLINQIFNSSLNENNNGILKEHRKNSSLCEYPSSPQKLMFSSSLASISEQQKIANTPSKLSILANTNLTNIQSKDLNVNSGGVSGAGGSGIILATNTSSTSLNMSSSFSSSFECPECEKKFVSYYGLVQHYDQHPNLKVTCMLCEITFENHHLLVMHNTNVHHLVENNHDKVKENLISSNQLLSKKISESLTLTNQNSNKTGNNHSKSNNAKFNLTTKSKSLLDESSGDSLDALTVTNVIASNDLSSLPSIMTRTSRLTTAPNQPKQSILGASTTTTSTSAPYNTANGSVSKPSLITSAAILNHTLTVKTSGFADLSFIDFSCVNFPRIAQNYCELWPRKLQLNQFNSSGAGIGPTPSLLHSQQQQHQFLQPLHNYMCETCGFYFPCKASLHLHKIKKSFATSKLIIKEENLESCNGDLKAKELSSQCQLFMTNSKYLDYEKTLDEIITKIEQKQVDETQIDECKEKNEFLKIFGLVNVSSFAATPNTVIKTSNKYENLSPTTIAINSNVVSHKSLNLNAYINPKPFQAVNLTEKLLIKLRKQMLNINHQFIVDLNRWKFIHSSPETNGHFYFSTQSSQQSNISFDTSQYSSKIHLKPHVNLNRPLLIRSKKLKRNAQKLLLQTITTKTPISITSNNPPINPTVNNSIKNNSAPLTSAQKTNSNFNKEELNKLQSNVSKNNNTTSSKITAVVNKNSKPKETILPPTSLSKKSISNISFSKPVFNSTTGNFSAALNSTKNASKRKINDTPSSMPTLLAKNSKQHQTKRKLSNDGSIEETEDKYPMKITKQENSNATKKRVQHDLPSTIPPPPLLPIYKTIVSVNTSANSTRLASASGMMPPKLPKLEPCLPKLTKILPTPILESKPDYEILKAMPKLKPQQNIINNFGLIPPPPQLEPFGVKLERMKKKSNSTGSDNSNTSTSSSSSNGSNGSSSSSNSGAEQDKNSKSENISLKCKFCRTSFHGQSEFFQHVIVKHNKMVKQRINKARVGSANANSNSRLDHSSPSSNSSSHINLVNSSIVEANSQSSIS